MENQNKNAKKSFVYSLISIVIITVGIIIVNSSKGWLSALISFSLLVIALVISFFARKDINAIKKEGSINDKRIAKFSVIVGKVLEIMLALVVIGGIVGMLSSMIFNGNL